MKTPNLNSGSTLSDGKHYKSNALFSKTYSLAAVEVEITPHTELEVQHTNLIQHIIGQNEQELARKLLHRVKNVGEDDEEHAEYFQLLTKRASPGSPPPRVAGCITVQFRHEA